MSKFRSIATVVRFLASSVIAIAFLLAPPPVRAEDAATAKALTPERLEQLVAPIALYPDPLLSQVLMASTYPLEVVEAARWSRDNPNVTGKALEDAMQKQPWDPSVKALTAVPQTLQMMNDQVRWTQDLGDAFLADQAAVFDAVQRLRARADTSGNLKSTPQQKVTKVQRPAAAAKTAGAPASAYVIEPTNPNEYFVPVYDPGVVYGDWLYPGYEPFYWYPPGWAGGWWGFGSGFLAGAAIWGGVNWWNRHVHVNPLRFNQFNRTNITNTNWAHNAAHRRGVPYGNQSVANRFGDQGRGKARDAARQNIAQGGMGQGGKGGMGQGGMGQAGMGGQKIAGGMGMGGMGQGGMGGQKVAGGGMGMGGMGQGGMGMGGMGGQKFAGGMGGGRGSLAAGMGRMGGGGAFAGGGGGGRAAFAGGGRGGGAFRGGGGGFRGGGGRGGGRRSDVVLKHDIALLGYLGNGLAYYRFAYHGSDTAYVGVMAQDVQRIMPEAVVRGRDGYLRVFYDKLGVTFQTYDQWIASGAQIPTGPQQ